MKRFLVAAAALVLLLESGASAALVFLDNWTSPVTVGDKTFTPISHSLSTSVNAFIDIEVSGNIHTGTYSFNLGGLGSVTGGLNAVVEYQVTINDPGWVFKTVGLDSTHIADNTSVTKDVFSDSGFTNLLATQSAINGVPGTSVNVSGGDYTTLYIRDTTVLDATGSLAGYSNTFTQTQTAPVPGTLTMVGLAALSMIGVRFWRRRTAQCG